MSVYIRPIVSTDMHRPQDALSVAGGWTWFNQVEVIERSGRVDLIPAREVAVNILDQITSTRASLADLSMNAPRIMGILNATPDSFSDGGKFDDAENGLHHAAGMIKDGADILDIGGESTRPGAQQVSVGEEIRRTASLIAKIRATSGVPISIDTRKSQVAQSAINAGATLVNDVSAFDFDVEMAATVASAIVPICLMHAQGSPETMQQNPNYDAVLLDVYDALEAKIAHAVASGIPKSQIIVDPGVGFGKTMDHNLSLLKGISLFHSLGCAILVGVSRKRFIGTIGNAPDPENRAAGSIAVAMNAVAQGVQILRVHDVAQTRQALSLHQAVTSGR